MKHHEMRPETACQIYGHGDLRWLPCAGPPPLPQDEDEQPMALACLSCDQIIRRST